MPNLYNVEYVKNVCSDLNLILLSDGYSNVKSPLKVMDKEGYLYCSTLDYLHKKYKYNPDKIFRRFEKSNIYVIDNIIHWLEENNSPCKFSRGDFTGMHKKTLYFICSCGNEFNRSFQKVKDGQTTCLNCSVERISSATRHTVDNVIEALKEFDISLLPNQIYKNNKEKIFVKCNLCGYEWGRILHSNSGCPKCSFSKGEDRISNFLIKENILFTSQKVFSECRGKKRPLPFDFYLDYINLLIEYQGEQHYFPVDFAGNGKEWAKEQFKNVVKKDKIKVKYCKENNIPLLIIPYTEYERIEEIIGNFLEI